MRKTFFSFLFIVSCFLLITHSVSAQSDIGWIITNFDADIVIAKDTAMTVTETIDVDFGNLQKHGIFRYIPVRYRTNTGDSLDVRLELLSVTDETGKRFQYQLSREGENIKIKIGDPDVTISGKNTYVVTYQVQRVITRPHDQAELYWNVTGNGWPVPIRDRSRYSPRIDCSHDVFHWFLWINRTSMYWSTA